MIGETFFSMIFLYVFGRNLNTVIFFKKQRVKDFLKTEEVKQQIKHLVPAVALYI